MTELETAILKVLGQGGWKTGDKILDEINTEQKSEFTIGAFYTTASNLVRVDEIRERKLPKLSRQQREYCLTPKGCKQKNTNSESVPKTNLLIA